MTPPDRAGSFQATARVALVGIFWGLNWPAMKIALGEVTPWTMRALGLLIGALALFGWGWVRGRGLAVPPGRQRLHLAMVGLLSGACYNLFSAFAQLGAATSRVVIVVYSMPVWATLLARVFLGERLDAIRRTALAAGIAGLAVLLYPLTGSGVPVGIVYAWAAGATWAAGTVYLKWARIDAAPLAIAAWQLVAGGVVAALGLAVDEGVPHLWPLEPATVLALAYHVLLGIAFGSLLWFEVVARVTVVTASLGALLVPVVGVASSVLILGERPTAADSVGFALMLTAAACVLFRPVARPPHPGG